MKHVIVDTNVPLKAADFHPKDELDLKCSQACLSYIKSLMASDDVVAVDTGWEIINEYKRKIDIHAEDNVAS